MTKMLRISDKNLRKLLLKCVLSDAEIFPKAFAECEKWIVYEDLDFQSFELLSAIYPKFYKHKINSHLALRIKGAYRRTWTENQLLLDNLKGLFSVLDTTQIKFIIAEGRIRLAEIYHDLGMFSLQNFQSSPHLAVKKNFTESSLKTFGKLAKRKLKKLS